QNQLTKWLGLKIAGGADPRQREAQRFVDAAAAEFRNNLFANALPFGDGPILVERFALRLTARNRGMQRQSIRQKTGHPKTPRARALFPIRLLKMCETNEFLHRGEEFERRVAVPRCVWPRRPWQTAFQKRGTLALMNFIVPRAGIEE